MPETVYKVTCESSPDVLADGLDSFDYAKHVAECNAKEIWEERNVSLFCVVKDGEDKPYFAVRYTPANGGTYIMPTEYYLSVGA